MYRQILVPTDGSACSDEAVAHAVRIGRAMGSTLVFLFAMDTLAARREGIVNIAEARLALSEQGQAVLDRAMKTAEHAGVRATCELDEDSAVDVIARRAPEFDLVVMGSHGKGIMQRIAIGSVTHAVLHRIRRPLLIVRGGEG